MIDENIVKSLRDFSQWFQQYNQEKKDQQDFGIRNMPARVFRKTVDLSTAVTLQATGIPFNGIHVEKIYVTATGVSADGFVSLIFDRATADSQFNYKNLKENDSFTTGFTVAKGFLSWAAQAGMSADLVFFNDIDFRSGSQKTSIISTVTTNPANTTATLIKQVPDTPTIQRSSGASTATYTIPAGKYGIMSCSVGQNANGNGATVSINGVVVLACFVNLAMTNSMSGIYLAPGDVVLCDGKTVNGLAAATIATFPT